MGVSPPPSSTPKTSNKAPRQISDARRIRKPITEKKRRDRINTCLSELASLLTEAKLIKTEESKNSKIEKADILELTVKYWKDFKCQTITEDAPSVNEENMTIESSYIKGYKQCIRLADTLLKEYKESTETLRINIKDHLHGKIEELIPKNSSSAVDTPEFNDITESSGTVLENDQKNDDVAITEKISSSSSLTLVPKRIPNVGLVLILQSESTQNNTDSDNLNTNISSESSNHLIETYLMETDLRNDNLIEKIDPIINENNSQTTDNHHQDRSIHDQELVDIIAENGIDIDSDAEDDVMWRPW